jgi:iron-sulfur cluster assembly protein
MKNITMAKLAEMIGDRKEDMPVAIGQAAIGTPQKRRIVNLTPIAATKLRELQQQDGKPFLRVSVISEGPTGYMYDLKFDDEANAGNDYLDEMEGISVVVDKRSALFLEDATIDWQTTADGRQGFEFDNPNAVK